MLPNWMITAGPRALEPKTLTGPRPAVAEFARIPAHFEHEFPLELLSDEYVLAGSAVKDAESVELQQLPEDEVRTMIQRLMGRRTN